ncbi:putative tyrosyl-DNA phosphodiesterase [Diplodia seriata]|uniref:Putative tyrosyl-DNA phosphodiesterase n=1 Tax=Diplodia seriata TaxID=420778 RepID=A0A1S8BMZ4_9PEZI|nr:putative tyrosyl-DNA phosphodiesterase [Diplodia seriata]
MQRSRRSAAFPPRDEDEEQTTTNDEESTTDDEGDDDDDAEDDNGSGGCGVGGGGRQVGRPESRARHQQDVRPAKRLKRDEDDGGARATATTTAAAVTAVDSSSRGTLSTPLRSLERKVSPPVRRWGRTGAVVDSEAETEDEEAGLETEDEDEVGVVLEAAKVKKVDVASTGSRQQREIEEGLDRATTDSSPAFVGNDGDTERGEATFVSSPVQLTRICDLPPTANVDALALKDILGDPLIVEMWQFNYMFDVDFLMSALYEDVRGSMRVKVVHGNWRREDAQRQNLEEWSKRYSNLEVIQAYMPEAFGTHHSKMMILIRADDSAQVVIHTANMVPKDWTNMTNAVWRSPLLPLLPETCQPHHSTPASTSESRISGTSNARHAIGTGQRFKVDLLRYLSAYGKRLSTLTKQLVRYDFSTIRAALVASTPNRVKLDDTNPDERTSWGWVGLREVLSQVPLAATDDDEHTTVAQVSSIATLDQAGAWLRHFRSILGTTSIKHASSRSLSSSLATPPSSNSSNNSAFSYPTGFQPASNPPRPRADEPPPPPPAFRIIFPTVADVRASLDGYRAGGSIHLKTQSAAQKKQVAYMRPLLCRWNTSSSSSSGATTGTESASSADDQQRLTAGALRSAAAPHVKTYVRYATTKKTPAAATRIEWAMLTSANLSTQAWGALPAVAKCGDNGGGGAKGKNIGRQVGGGGDEKGKEVRICSWEVGVVVWPALFAENALEGGGKEAVMVPVFGSDGPQADDVRGLSGGEKVVVGWRMPYDWPLTPYQEGDEPWCPTARYGEPDVNGCVWQGF